MENKDSSKIVPVDVITPMKQFPKSEIQSVLTQLDQVQPFVALSFLTSIPKAIAQPFIDWKKIGDETKIKTLQIETEYQAYIEWLDRETIIRLEHLKNSRAIIKNNRAIIENSLTVKMKVIEDLTKIISEQAEKGNDEIVKVLSEQLTKALETENQPIIELLEKQN